MDSDPSKLANHLFQLRSAAAEIRKSLKLVQDSVDEAEMALVESLSALPEAQRTVRVPAGTISAVWKSRPEVSDLAAFHEHILTSRNLSFLQNRVSESAVKKVWESGESVPGVTRIDLMDLSYSTAKGVLST